MDEKSLSHTKWKCQYHLVLVPKYRRKVIYKELRKDIGVIIRKLCDYKKVEIIEAHAMPDHIHMLISIPPKLAVSDFVGYLKGKSTLMIFERHANMKYKYGRRVFWAKGYYISTVGGNKKAIQEYIRNQELEDQMMDQISFKEYEDPFQNARSMEDDDSPNIPPDSRAIK
ncbi:MAG: IS200/IS605 family transposase [Oscillospiraceae bacterium]|nr:IS200/IS605 family transposase [Oscillospiraceae bacterium]